MTWKSIHKILRIVWIFAGLLFMAWLFASFQAKGFDKDVVFSSGNTLTASETKETVSFIPTQSHNTSIIFYPGAMVDPAAYAPLAKHIAEAGYGVYIVKLPYRLAPFSSHVDELFERTLQIMQDDKETKKWIIGGHSKGATLSTKFNKRYPDAVSGLLLIGTSHPKDEDSSLLSITSPILKISASEDGLASVEEIRENSKYLPPQTDFYEISGGNHSQFGYYGFQIGDHRATITREDQQRETLERVLDFMGKIQAIE